MIIEATYSLSVLAIKFLKLLELALHMSFLNNVKMNVR
jgi:hypothetical protein